MAAEEKTTSAALVSKDSPGEGILVDGKNGRPIGDTSSSSVFVEELPKNFHGGDEALHFALGQLFGKFGKIKKIELYMEKGILETEDFKGEALIVYHPTKMTGKREKGDPVYEACYECDGRWCLLGHRHWRIRCEPAKWQKEGYDVKQKDKLWPCVELSNLWEYDPSQPIGYYGHLQEQIRLHAAEHIESPFVKVDPSSGMATVWCKGAQDSMKFGSLMQKSYFMGRKVEAALCRKAKPKIDHWDGMDDYSKMMDSVNERIKAATAAGTFTLQPKADGALPSPDVAPAAKPAKPVDEGKALAAAFAADIAAATGPYRLKKNTRVRLKDLTAKPENNGKTGDVVEYLHDVEKYKVKLDFDKTVKVKRENLEILDELTTEEQIMTCEHKAAERRDEAAEALAASEAAKAWAEVLHSKPKAIADSAAAENFTATVCVDPSLLRKTEEEEEKLRQEEERAAEERRRRRSRSRERIQKERLEAAQARLAATGEKRSGWCVPSPGDAQAAAQAGTTPSAGTTAAAGAQNQPEESREELMKLSVGKLKALLTQYGKSARGCLEKRDFVDRLKPAPKT